jgi:AcrR family transcriptional regulator
MSDETTNPPDAASLDPTSLSLDELRKLRTELQQQDDVVSYARRVAQARVDLVKSEMARRADDGNVSDEVTEVLSQHLTGGPGRPPRPAEDLSDNTLSAELDAICKEAGFGRIDELDEEQLAALADAIGSFERRVSQDRRRRFDLLDALSAELVRRYRDGEADVDSLLNN